MQQNLRALHEPFSFLNIIRKVTGTLAYMMLTFVFIFLIILKKLLFKERATTGTTKMPQCIPQKYKSKIL